MKLTPKKIQNTIRGRMSRKEYWERRKELRAAYKKQLMEATYQSTQMTLQG